MTTYYWLNQRPDETNNYEDEIGDFYHFTDRNRAGKSIEPGDRFLYYLPGEHIIFGHGVFGDIEELPDEEPDVREHYKVDIVEYEEISTPVNARDIREEISFLKREKGLRGVPQESIRAIPKEDFVKLIGER
jgi:hypothetical protein